MPRSSRVNVGICSFAFLLAGPHCGLAVAHAQTPTSTSPAQLIPRTKDDLERHDQAAHRVSLTVQVTDAAGKPVTGLKADDFTVLDNHNPQSIASFREVDGKEFKADLRVMVVLDAINDGGSGIGHLKKDLGKFLSQSKEPLPFPLSLVFVSEGGTSESHPSTDRATIAAELAQLAHRPHSPDCEQGVAIEGSRIQNQPSGIQGARAEEHANCVNAHLVKSVNALLSLMGEQQKRTGRGILIWTGTGWPMVENYGAGPGPEKPQGNYRNVLVGLTTDLREDEVTLNAISWDDFERPRYIHKPILSIDPNVPITPDELAEEDMALPALARRSGGQAFARVKDFADTFASLLADADRFYGLSFDSLPSKAQDEFHSIEVKVNRPGVTVRTSTGYYAEP